MSYLVPLIAAVFVVVVGSYLASVPREEDHQYIIVILGLIMPLVIVAIGVEEESSDPQIFVGRIVVGKFGYVGKVVEVCLLLKLASADRD
ncbi:hypothetical protein Tco_0368833 [Tanacetum coccineum]